MSRPVRAIAAALVLCACKGKGKEAPAPPPAPAAPAAPAPIAAPADAAVAPSDPWARCAAALRAAATGPETTRVARLLDGCRPCGDWAPILSWATPADASGPTRAAIEQAMAACDAWCEPAAKIRFLGALDAARGRASRGPWRALGEVCRDKVSAVPDTRYMSATYFALDRIARDAAARPDGPALLAAIELPLPAISITGAGVALPSSPVTTPARAPAQLTITQTELRVGKLPRATLGADGVVVRGDDPPYPGALVAPRQLASVLGQHGEPIVVFAPAGMAADRVVQAVRAADGRALQLAAASARGTSDWPIHGVVPVTLRSAGEDAGVELALGESADAAIHAAKATPPGVLRQGPVTLVVDRTATVADLAKLLGALAYYQVPAVALRPAKP